MFTSSISPHRRLSQWFLNALAWIILILLAIPAIWIVLTAFRPATEVNASPPVWIPHEITLDAFATVFGLNPAVQARVAVESYMFNSLFAAIFSTILSVAVGTLCGYAFARFHFRFHTASFLLLMFSRSVPGIALGLPLFLLFTRLG
jgi:multiple sugar transport system permease protein